MSDERHIEVARRAIEFRRPEYLPMEIIDVPHVYNAYHTLDPATVCYPGHGPATTVGRERVTNPFVSG